jgi:hypothetical protein
LKFAIAAILILLLISAPYAVTIFLSFYIGLKFKFGFWMIASQWGLMFLFLYLYTKLALIFPAAAAGHSISLKRVFALSKGYFWENFGWLYNFYYYINNYKKNYNDFFSLLCLLNSLYLCD